MKKQNLVYVLGVLASAQQTEQGVDFKNQITVSQDVIDFLDQHDVKYTESKHKVYVCNSVQYIVMGSMPAEEYLARKEAEEGFKENPPVFEEEVAEVISE